MDAHRLPRLCGSETLSYVAILPRARGSQSCPCSTVTEDCKQDKVSPTMPPIGEPSTLRSRPTPMRYLLCTPRLVVIYAL
jgi:hypothetical protein